MLLPLAGSLTARVAAAQSDAQPPAKAAARAAADSSTADERIAQLERRVRELERTRRSGGDSAAQQPKAPALNANPQGFGFRSPDGQFQIRFRGYMQSDGRFFEHDVQRPATSTFLMRRVRPIFEATLYRYLDFRLMPDFGGSAPTLYDAHVDVRFLPGLALRSGKFKPPIGLERLQSASDLAFVERAHPTNLVPNRDIGVQLYGDVLRGTTTYAAGVFNGVPDLGFGDGDNGNSKDLIGRVFVQPFKATHVTWLRELGLGIAGSRGIQRGTVAAPFLQTYRSPAQQSIFGFRTDGTVAGTTIADGLHTRIEPQGYWYAGRVGTMWEWVRSSQTVRRADSLTTLDNHAWSGTLSLTLTGEPETFRGVTPDHPFDPTHGQWGAVELVARLTRLGVDDRAFPLFANAATQIRSADTWAAGLNWYLSRGVRLLIDYNETRYRGGAASGGDRAQERAILTRIQHAF